MHLRSVIAEGGWETNLTDNCKSIREGGLMGCIIATTPFTGSESKINVVQHDNYLPTLSTRKNNN